MAQYQKTVFNRVPGDNQFELTFARFLDHAPDVARFSKLSMPFGFSLAYTDKIGNLRHYSPDFVVVDQDGVHYLVETKGRDDIKVVNKDQAAVMWAQAATELTGVEWQYVKILQADFEKMRALEFADYAYHGRLLAGMF